MAEALYVVVRKASLSVVQQPFRVPPRCKSVLIP